ncbi:MAG TPA: J domain-containing protein [Acidimicrobiales bacterium]|nr:J domain-containing protein [Acidimicrobiales bacterium]
MDVDEARAVLGLAPSATVDDARAAYRRLVRAHHPDLAGDVGPAPVAPPPAPVVDATTDGDTITLDVPADEAFLVLLEAAHRVGDVTHVSPGDALLEALIAFDDGRTCSLVISLQGRANGTTDAFCTLQALDAGATPPVGLVVDALVEELSPRG